jgi:hypothetical protein
MASRLCVFVACVVLIGSVMAEQRVEAQVVNAELSGSVVDQSGAVLPGATITASGTQTGVTRVVTTDERGRYVLLALPPGSYEIKVELQGFKSELRSGVTLTINRVIQLDFKMEMAGVAAEVTVTGEAPLISTTRAELGKTVETNTIDTMPLIARNFVQLATLVAGVKTPAPTQTLQTLNIGGQSFGVSDYNAFMVDGVDASLSETNGGAPAAYSQDAIAEFQVLTNQFSAEFGRAQGGIVNILTRSGTNQIHARGYYFIHDNSVDSQPYFSTSTLPFKRQDFGGTVGGPIVPNRTHYFVSVERIPQTQIASIVTPTLREDYSQASTDTRVFGKLTQQLGQGRELQVANNYNPTSSAGNGIGGIKLPDSGTNATLKNDILSASQTWVFSSSRLNELRFGFMDSKSDSLPIDPQGPEIDRPSSITGRANASPQHSTFKRYEFAENFTQHFEWSGAHSVKAGTNIVLIRDHGDVETFFGGQYIFSTDQPFNPAVAATYPTQYTVRTGNPINDTPENWYGFYVRDNWQARSNVMLNLGVRYDASSDFGGILQAQRKASPRLAAVWTPTENKWFVVRGGYGRYYDQFFANMAFNLTRAGAPPGTYVLPNGVVAVGRGSTSTLVTKNPGYPDPSLPNPFLKTSSPALQDGAINDGLQQTPYSDQMNLGFSLQLSKTMAVSADYIHTRGHDIERNFDYNAVNPVTGLRPNQNLNRLYSYQTSGSGWYDALQTSFEKRVSHGYEFVVAYTLAHSMDDVWIPYTNIAGSAPQSYFNVDAEKSDSVGDQRHHVVISGSGVLPFGFKVGAILTAGSGVPYNIITGRDNNGDGNVTDRPNVNPNGTGNAQYVDPGVGPGVQGNLARNAGRGGAFVSLDGRVSRVIKTGTIRVEPMLEAFNVLNRVNYSTYQANLQSALFGQPIAAYNARQVQFGLRMDFGR